MKFSIISILFKLQWIPGHIISYNNLMEEASIDRPVVIRVMVVVKENNFWWWDSKPENVDYFHELI